MYAKLNEFRTRYLGVGTGAHLTLFGLAAVLRAAAITHLSYGNSLIINF